MCRMKNPQRIRSAYIWGIRVLLCGSLLCSYTCLAQDSECASVSKEGGNIVLIANSWDPVAALAQTLADRYGISVSVEAPKWDFPRDTEDVAIADPQYSATHNHVHYQVMKRHLLQVRVPATVISATNDVPALLRRIADAANKVMPYGYRVDVAGRDYGLVPTKTRNSTGVLEEIEPLLDRHVTIPDGMRPIAEHAKLLAQQLSQQTGFHVSCCQSVIFGIPWGMAKVQFGATNKPAREVLKALMQLEHETNSQSSFIRWVVRCDGTGAPWCSIDLAGRFSTHCK